jgi:hypothetical protein
LILNPGNCKRYIEVHWLKKWAKPILASVKALWEKYREEAAVPLPSHMPFSYNNPSQDIPEMDPFDKIALSLYTVARPASEDEYKDYNLQDSYNPGKRGALV